MKLKTQLRLYLLKYLYVCHVAVNMSARLILLNVHELPPLFTFSHLAT